MSLNRKITRWLSNGFYISCMQRWSVVAFFNATYILHIRQIMLYLVLRKNVYEYIYKMIRVQELE